MGRPVACLWPLTLELWTRTMLFSIYYWMEREWIRSCRALPATWLVVTCVVAEIASD